MPLNDRARAYMARRLTKPMTEAEYRELTTELDPTGEYGLRILERHLVSIDRVAMLCRCDPKRPKIKALIRAEYTAFGKFIAAVSAEAAAAYEKRNVCADGLNLPSDHLGEVQDPAEHRPSSSSTPDSPT